MKIHFGKGIRLLLAAILIIGIAAYIVYAIIVASTNRQTDTRVCEGINLLIEENAHAGFITNISIEHDLKEAGLYPKGRLIKDVSTNSIEKLLQQNEFIENAECYKTANNKVTIEITQRTPVIYIMPDNVKGYYVDIHGSILKNKSYPINIPVATGNISQQYATKQLYKLGKFLLDNDFWNSQTEQIYISLNREKEHQIDIVPRVGHQIIHLGTIDNFEKKLERLKTFYTQAMPNVGWNKYSDINLEYNNQIIGTKPQTK